MQMISLPLLITGTNFLHRRITTRRVPQVLHYFGVIQYSEDLITKIRNGEEIDNGSEFEVEIRAATILAVHLGTTQYSWYKYGIFSM
uniref:Queuosine 5'-phosphate N-glycosylase/hydrolase n=1 Tax=Trichobilharzia regenti TaxID=157069 RepID=A0AA85IQW0_TRIRE|nr:unnamed protein product [Trichobilharzia regenti]